MLQVEYSWLRLVRTLTSKAEPGTTIGVLSFEVSTLMFKAVQLWHSLTDGPIARLRNGSLDLEGVRKLVSEDDDFLLDLALAEITDSIGSLSSSVARLGQRCSNPLFRVLVLLFNDHANAGIDHYGFVYATKKMDRKVQKMERFIAASNSLYEELEVLAEFEQELMHKQRKAHSNYRNMVALQREKVNSLQDKSIWGRSYDYTVRLLARSLFTILARMKEVFGFHNKEASTTRFSSGPLLKPPTTLLKPDLRSGSIPRLRRHRSKINWLVSSTPFGGCTAGGADSPVLESYTAIDREIVNGETVNRTDNAGSEAYFQGKASTINLSLHGKILNPPQMTLGEAALALHYANVIIVIEKLVLSPHLMGRDAREDLYSMLPSSIRAELRVRLKSHAKNLASAIYDPILSTEWREDVTRILEWLAPLAHNMIKWQSERNFEKKHLDSSPNVLLLETLYFASQVKTEAAITELLVGLNYLWRFRHELSTKAVLQFVGSRKYDDCLDSKG